MSITDKQVLAAACSLNNCEEDIAKGTLGKRGFERLRAALEAAEKAAWRPIEEAPKDVPILMRPKDAGLIPAVLGRARDLYDSQANGLVTFLEDYHGRRYLLQNKFRPLPKGPSDD